MWRAEVIPTKPGVIYYYATRHWPMLTSTTSSSPTSYSILNTNFLLAGNRIRTAVTVERLILKLVQSSACRPASIVVTSPDGSIHGRETQGRKTNRTCGNLKRFITYPSEDLKTNKQTKTRTLPQGWRFRLPGFVLYCIVLNSTCYCF